MAVKNVPISFIDVAIEDFGAVYVKNPEVWTRIKDNSLALEKWRKDWADFGRDRMLGPRMSGPKDEAKGSGDLD